MDISVIILLFAEALLALAALYFSGLLKRPRDVAVSAALIALGVHLDKERQRNGGPVNPPLPPQR